MAANGVAQALMAMDDEGMRAAVAGGDLSGLGDMELTGDERELLQTAAAEDPDVTGFSMSCNGLTSRGLLECNGFTSSARGLGLAGTYAAQGISGPDLAFAFGNWFSLKRAQGGW